MKNILVLCIAILCSTNIGYCYTTRNNSPSNWNNSVSIFQNSPMNFQNSPMNYQNSPMNPNANIIYDSYGNAQGYAVQKSNGTGVNIYDFKGNRSGYYNY